MYHFTFPPVTYEGSNFDWNCTESVGHYGGIAILTLSFPIYEYEVFSLFKSSVIYFSNIS